MTIEHKDNSLPAVPEGKGEGQRVTVITPEIMTESGGERHESAGSAGGTRFSYTTWNTGSGAFGNGTFGSGTFGSGMVARDGCLPALITLLLAAVCAVQFGVLSAIGFLVFYAIGSAAGFLLRVRSLMQGTQISPWIFRVGAWGLASVLVVWLSDGF